jgi:hypothetical protein
MMTLGSIAQLAAAGSLLVAAPVKATLSAPGHTPKVKTRWYYTVRVTKGGKPVRALITVQIVDPIGGVHAVEFGPSTKKITKFPFKGTFRDYIIWPPDSAVGLPLTLRVIVEVGKVKRTLRYKVTPRA